VSNHVKKYFFLINNKMDIKIIGLIIVLIIIVVVGIYLYMHREGSEYPDISTDGTYRFIDQKTKVYVVKKGNTIKFTGSTTQMPFTAFARHSNQGLGEGNPAYYVIDGSNQYIFYFKEGMLHFDYKGQWPAQLFTKISDKVLTKEDADKIE